MFADDPGTCLRLDWIARLPSATKLHFKRRYSINFNTSLGVASIVEKLKQSLEQLEAPVCSACQIDMRWMRSALIATEPTTIAHLFVCVNCNHTAETKSSVRPVIIPSGKLSAPSRLRAA